MYQVRNSVFFLHPSRCNCLKRACSRIYGVCKATNSKNNRSIRHNSQRARLLIKGFTVYNRQAHVVCFSAACAVCGLVQLALLLQMVVVLDIPMLLIASTSACCRIRAVAAHCAISCPRITGRFATLRGKEIISYIIGLGLWPQSVNDWIISAQYDI